MVIVIGLALFAFIAGDAWKVMQPHQAHDVGEVNGDALSAQEYQNLVEEYTEVVKLMRGVTALNDEQTSQLFDYKIPALLICRSLPVDEECLAMAKKHNISILRSSEATSSFCSSLISYLRAELAPMVTRHGVLMEIYGEGVLLTGESGIGKSEAALELLKRGHRLIADDAVEIRRISTNTLAGSAPELIRNYIELRGIGIVNVAKLFGMGSVRSRKAIDLVVNIVPWNNQDAYDRLGLEEQYMEILGVKIPMNTIPITPGRNLAVILEVAAINIRQRKLGYNAAQEFTDQINKHFAELEGKE